MAQVLQQKFHQKLVWCIIALGLILRVGFLLKWAREPQDSRFVADPYAYVHMAQHAYHGRLFVSFRGFPTSYLSVGYPTIIAAAQRLAFGLVGSWAMALMLNLVSYVLTTIGIFRIVRIFARRTPFSQQSIYLAQLLSVAILAIYPDFIFATGLVMTELVAVTFLVWGIVYLADLLENGYSQIKAIGAGACFGLTVFVRPSIFLIIVLVPFFMVYRRQWKGAAIVFVVGMLPVIPLWINNSRVGTGTGITSATWMNVCDGLVKSDGTFEWRPECRQSIAVGEEPNPKTESINTAHAKKLALQEISAHPAEWISRMPLRVYHSLWSGGWATQVSVKWGQNYKWTENIDLFLLLSRRYFQVISTLALIQIARFSRRRLMTWWPIGLIFIGTFAGIPISFGQPRFGWPLAVIVLVPLASLGIAHLAADINQRNGKYVFSGR